jgi:hypothetical protein
MLRRITNKEGEKVAQPQLRKMVALENPGYPGCPSMGLAN